MTSEMLLVPKFGEIWIRKKKRKYQIVQMGEKKLAECKTNQQKFMRMYI